MANHKSQNHSLEANTFSQLETKEVQTLMQCASICTACAARCIEEGHKATARICADCADICAIALKAHCCQSEFEQPLLDICAQACQRCAEECEKVQAAHCQTCAQACKRCAEACSTAYSYA